MLSRLDSYLIDEYYNAKRLLDTLFINHKIGSEIILLMLVNKEDSLLNCLCKVSVNKCLEEITKIDFKNNKLELDDIIELSYNIALKDKGNKINDEHLLYGMIMFDNYIPSLILSKMDVDLTKLKEDVEDYFNDDNSKYLVNMTSLGKQNKFEKTLVKKEYINRIIRIINKKQKCNCLLIGNAGVGKSCIVEALTMELLKIKSSLNIYRLDLGCLLAGTRYRGDLEERIESVLDDLKNDNSILFIDEIHNICGSNNNDETFNIANILKPALARNEIKCIGATTLDEYLKYIVKDKALTRRFQIVYIKEATIKETIDILNHIKDKYQKYYNVRYSKNIINEIVKRCSVMPNRKYPDKAIDLLDEVGSFCNMQNKKVVTNKMLDKVILEILGIYHYYNSSIDILNYYFNNLIKGSVRKNILSLDVNNLDYLKEIKKQYNLTEEQILMIDLEIFNEIEYKQLINNILKYQIVLVILINLKKASFITNTKINKMRSDGLCYDNDGNIIYLSNVIFLNLDNQNNENYFGFRY